jgi:hypothetical protein
MGTFRKLALEAVIFMLLGPVVAALVAFVFVERRSIADVKADAAKVVSAFAHPTNVQDEPGDFFSTGNKLLSFCDVEPNTNNKYLVCMGYISGFVSGYESLHNRMVDRMAASPVKDRVAVANAIAEAGPQLCIPAGVSRAQATDTVVLYLKNHPATRHLPSEDLIIEAIGEAFSCK